ncbi:MAG: AcrB/AcrD/AcrF family protein [Epsilonproteobacteria bacterium]|nr:MAG: AcrB/AcrD/AcrF family protein [Campylobacterota bacterium]RLA65369.1 MAG: AcrB/AcrD/AcrF family protein [Campylobacterota bacterium]
MSFEEISIRKRSLTWFFIVVIVIIGLKSFDKLAKLEDPEYTIKEARIYVDYPGATVQEMEDEVVYPIENELQELPYTKRITSTTYPGRTEIAYVAKDRYRKGALNQIWDEVRKKLRDVQIQLPPGVSPPRVIDDFGDVYGIYYSLTGEGYTYKELKDFIDVLKREILLVDGVRKVIIGGAQKEVIYVEVSRSKLKNLGISVNRLSDLFVDHNYVSPIGEFNVGDEYLRANITGKFSSVEDIENILVSSEKGKLIFLKDIAIVKRKYIEPFKHRYYVDGKPALTLAISADTTKNILKTGERLGERMKTLILQKPPGMKLRKIYNQAEAVGTSIKGFVVNLVEAVVIVIVVLLIFMGWRSGVIIGSVLFLIMMATAILMEIYGIPLQRISLGALIIALGMLVDNAIVVAEGMLIKIEKGEDKIKSALDVIKQTKWSLLGTTIIAIVAFAPIGLSDHSTGEYCNTLFWVILISLLVSWLLAITVTPMLGTILYKKKEMKKGEELDPYNNIIFRAYKSLLTGALKFRTPTLILMVVLLVLAIFGFTQTKKMFFPDSTTPLFMVDYFRQEGTDARTMEKDGLEAIELIKKVKGVTNVSLSVGQGYERFMLTYQPETPNKSYMQFLVEVDDYSKILEIGGTVLSRLNDSHPFAQIKIKQIALGPTEKAKIMARFSGRDPDKLREIANKAMDILKTHPNAVGIRTDWRDKVKNLKVEYSQDKARLTGVSRKDVKDSFLINFTGKEVGIYREGIHLLPIILRAPEGERLDVANASDIQVWSSPNDTYIPISQVVKKISTGWDNNIVGRRNRRKTIQVLADPRVGLWTTIFKEVKEKIEKIPLPVGYDLEWGGDYESSTEGGEAVFGALPAGFFIMFLISVFLFQGLKQPVVIWLTVPLAIIGVTFGLLFTGTPFGFMSLLGILSLSGMLLKNAIILVDQIDLEISTGKEKFKALIDACLSRVRPVSLAAMTTALGMIPLFPDAFFKGMAVTIVFGLIFATILTLLIVPVLYSLVFKIPYKGA